MSNTNTIEALKAARDKAIAEFHAADAAWGTLYRARITDSRIEYAEHERENAAERMRQAGAAYNRAAFGY